jgi:preprotein translocase subunit YajC
LSQLFIAFQAVPAAENAAAPISAAASPSTSAEPAFGGWGMMLMFLPMLFLIFWQSRNQKKAETLVNDLKKGDRVLTQSGLVGRLVEIDARYAKLELAPNVKVTVLRSSLTGRDTEDPVKSSTDSAKAENK